MVAKFSLAEEVSAARNSLWLFLNNLFAAMLPASLRFTKKDFSLIKTRVIYRGDIFDLAYSDAKALKIACVISKKRMKLATERNRVRRKILHATSSLLKQKALFGYFVIYPKPLPRSFPYQKIEEEISKAFATL